MRKRTGKGVNTLVVAGALFSGMILLAGGVAAFLAIQSSPAQAKEITVYKSPDCECCNGWAKYLEQKGYRVTVLMRENMDEIKTNLGVPDDMQSCHTAKIGGYIVEGHVPVEAIDKLLAEHPKVTGIAAPGMPSSAPGMDGPKEPYTVYTFSPQGEAKFAEF